MVRDPRTTEADSQRFLDMMERYFSQDVAAKMADVRPELHYQASSPPPALADMSQPEPLKPTVGACKGSTVSDTDACAYLRPCCRCLCSRVRPG